MKPKNHPEQLAICEKYGVLPCPYSPHDKVGTASSVKTGDLPIHGLRIQPENGTSGWYIWAGGEMSEEDDFFAPLHISHLDDWSPLISRFLLLPPGWRFLVTPKYEDVWFDENLLSE